MVRIFLSYASEDIEYAQRIYSILNSLPEVDVWFDKESLLPGQKWDVEIKKAILSCRYFLVLLSSASTQKIGYSQREIHEAIKVLEDYPGEDIYLIPARLDDCTPRFEQLRALHYVDFFPSFESGLGCIVKLLKQHQCSEAKSISATHLRFCTHIAQFVPYQKLFYFLTVTNLEQFPIEVTHAWYDGLDAHIPIQPESRRLPKRLAGNEIWETWISVDNIPEQHRQYAFDYFRIRLSSGDVYLSVKDEAVPPYGTVPGGGIYMSDL